VLNFGVEVVSFKIVVDFHRNGEECKQGSFSSFINKSRNHY